MTDVNTASSDAGRLQINGLGDDDVVTVDVDGPSDVIGVPITFDGGGGSDLLAVIGDPATTVDEVIYAPGPDVTEGRLTYEGAGALLMTIDFANLEPVKEAVVAGTLTVLGTNADNAINYVEGPNSGNAAAPFNGAITGLVSIDGFETIEFANKTWPHTI